MKRDSYVLVAIRKLLCEGEKNEYHISLTKLGQHVQQGIRQLCTCLQKKSSQMKKDSEYLIYQISMVWMVIIQSLY